MVIYEEVPMVPSHSHLLANLLRTPARMNLPHIKIYDAVAKIFYNDETRKLAVASRGFGCLPYCWKIMRGGLID